MPTSGRGAHAASVGAPDTICIHCHGFMPTAGDATGPTRHLCRATGQVDRTRIDGYGSAGDQATTCRTRV